MSKVLNSVGPVSELRNSLDDRPRGSSPSPPPPTPPASSPTSSSSSLAAKLGDEVFKRIGQPAIVGEILGGVLIGPSVLGLVEITEVLRVFSELGVVFLLFWVGLETRLSEMKAVGPIALGVGSTGVLVPFLAGIAFGLVLGERTETTVFLGAALAATSAGITSATFLDLGIARSRAARTVLGAAVVDDILALILLSVAVGMAGDGGVDIGKIALAGGGGRLRRLCRAGRDATPQRAPAAPQGARASPTRRCSRPSSSASGWRPSPPGSGWRR